MSKVGVPLKSSDLNLAALYRCLQSVLAVLPAAERERTGGYATIYRGTSLDNSSYEMVGCRVGSVPADKEAKYRAFSTEKPLRLSLHDDHRSSFESRDEANGQWPGAVRKDVVSDIFSFSGLPWKGDEALMLMYNVAETKEMTAAEAWSIAKISDNDVYLALMNKEPSLQGPSTTKNQ